MANSSYMSFPLFLFLLVTPTISFLLTVVLFPEPFHEPMNFQEHFHEERRSFFILAAFLPPLDFIDTLLKGVPHLLAQGLIYFVTISLLTALSVVGIVTKNKNYHKFFAIFFLIYISFFILINLNTLA